MDENEGEEQRPIVTDFDRPVYCLLGLPIDAVSLRETVEIVKGAARAKRRCFFTTPNLNYIVACRDDEDLRASVLRSDLSVADGMPLVWVAKALGIPLRERVAGSDLFAALRHDLPPPLSIYLFGGLDGAARAACAMINNSAGGMVCVGYCSPGHGSIEEMSVPMMREPVNASGADFLVVALPARKGQAWIMKNLDALQPAVVANLGAVVNFTAGTIERAPSSWQRFGLEWLWRIVQEPALWRRYASDGLAFLRLLITRVLPTVLDSRVNRPSSAALAAARVEIGTRIGRCVVAPSGCWTAANLGPLRAALASASAEPVDVVVDLSATVFLDGAAIGLLLLLRGHQMRSGRRLDISGLAPSMKRRFHLYGVRYLLTDPC